MTRKQFVVAVVIVLAIAIGALTAFLLLSSSSPEKNSVVSSRELTTDELIEVEILADTFLQEGASFGINLDTLTAETASQRMRDISDDNGGTSWLKRTEVASKLTAESVDLSGGFPFDLDGIANADYTDGNSVASFRPMAMDAEVRSKANYVYTGRNEPVLIATVDFNGSSTLAHFAQSSKVAEVSEELEDHDAEFTPWDISEQRVDLRGTLSISQDEEGGPWRIRNIEFDEGEFAFAFWSPEAFTTSYPETELGGTVVRSIEFPNNKEIPDVQG